ncbi:tetratricopeptide repeat protein [Polyangium sorediatum]|uniref:Tetratricopeptide repeat protein n=1 Tax=Polyangium sorediatum TaxID=889274 RepID=A0ABT6P6W6_9BACT|nr:hypothetical protein [Polyangium sorediatum]MDI1436363.1 hypothetical protein [Polyangium sorediatum]
MRCVLWFLAGLAVFHAGTERAWAQDTSGDAPAQAKNALDKAQEDLDAGRYAEACKALRQMYREDPRPATLYRIAQCYDKWGRIATAAVHYDDYLATFGQLSDTEQKAERDHEETASARREALEKRIPKVVLRVPREAPGTTRVLRKPLDEGPLVQVAIGVPLLIDPGEHVLMTEVPGRATTFTKFTLREGENRIVDVTIPTEGTTAGSPTKTAKPLQPVPSLMPALDPGISARRVAAYTLGGIGAVAILGGAVTGAITWAQMEPAETNCRETTDGTVCNTTGRGAKDTGAATGLISTVLFPVGFAALGAGALLYFTEPPPSKFESGAPKVRVGATMGPNAGAVEVDVKW